jgi:hypothetical protein
MKLPKIPAGYSLAIDSISASFADDTGNEHPMFLVSTEDDGGGAFLRLKLDAPQSGIVMNADELIAFAEIGKWLVELHDALNSEAPVAGDEPATGITPTAEKEPSV